MSLSGQRDWILPAVAFSMPASVFFLLSHSTLAIIAAGGHTIGHEDRTHEHRPRRKFTPLDLSLIVDHGSRFESTKPTDAGQGDRVKEFVTKIHGTVAVFSPLAPASTQWWDHGAEANARRCGPVRKGTNVRGVSRVPDTSALRTRAKKLGGGAASVPARVRLNARTDVDVGAQRPIFGLLAHIDAECAARMEVKTYSSYE
jgi:hypothetical protein